MKILVAEDEAVARTYLVSILQGMNHEVIVTTDGQEAWEAYQQ